MPSNSTQTHGQSAIETLATTRSPSSTSPSVNGDSRSDQNHTQDHTRAPLPSQSEGSHNGIQNARPASPSQVVAGARSSQELLRRLSLPLGVSAAREYKGSNPRTRHASLNLSGRIISANSVVPFTVKRSQDGEWVCHITQFHVGVFNQSSRNWDIESELRLFSIISHISLRKTRHGITFLLDGRAK
jgi:hypothetical protein